MHTTDPARRRFLLRSAVAAAALPLLALVPHTALADLPPLPMTNAQAKALHYVEDATKSDQSTRTPDSF